MSNKMAQYFAVKFELCKMSNYNKALSLKEVARQVYLSERHMSRVFK
jgi:transcriptional regulator GlxA family with amidase domain